MRWLYWRGEGVTNMATSTIQAANQVEFTLVEFLPIVFASLFGEI